MLLNEIVSLKDTLYISNSGIKRSGVLPDSGKSYQIIGQGYDAIVFKTEDSPTVVKILTSRPDIKDPYATFVMIVAKHGQDNPFFPKIKRIKTMRLSQQDQAQLHKDTMERKYHPAYGDIKFYAFEMEELQNIVTLTGDDQLSLMTNTFTQEYIDTLPRSYRPITTLTNMMEIAIDDSAPQFDKWKDPQHISQARNIINFCAKRTNVATDIHSQNLMARKTPDGYQLVIIDPLTTPSP